jgi:hypothetical protein
LLFSQVSGLSRPPPSGPIRCRSERVAVPVAVRHARSGLSLGQVRGPDVAVLSSGGRLAHPWPPFFRDLAIDLRTLGNEADAAQVERERAMLSV